MMKGYDISRWNAQTPLDRKFVIIKATEGIGFTDPKLNFHFNNAKNAGVLRGYYHFARPDLGNSANAEAEWFVSQLPEGELGQALLALDYEEKALAYGPTWARLFLDRVYGLTGVKPVIYIQGSVLHDYKLVADGDYDLWVAKWSSNAPDPSPWSYYALWQYTDDDNGYDGDWFNGTTKAWYKYAEPNPSHTPSQPQKSIDEVAREVINGDWGNGEDRKQRLEAAGYNYGEVQDKVNEILNSGSTSQPQKSIEEVAKEVINGDWGNGEDRKQRLEAAGYNYSEVQDKVNEILNIGAPSQPKKSIEEIAREVINGDWGNGEDRKQRLEAAGYNYRAVQDKVRDLLDIRYIVKPGDNLTAIANRYGTTVNRLVQDNNIANPNLIFPGQTIVIKR